MSVNSRYLAVFWAAILISGVHEAARARDVIILDPICQPGMPRNPPLPPGNPAPSTRKMAELLKKLAGTSETMGTPFLADRSLIVISNSLPRATNVMQKADLMFQFGVYQLLSGRPDFSLNAFGDLEEMLDKEGLEPSPERRKQMLIQKAISFLRLGEQENCIANSNADSCLFPLRPAAQHFLPRGSRGAIRLLEELLKGDSSDLGARWLLNIAYMTLSEYPDKVPPQFVIDPKIFASEYQMPRFPDIAAQVGLDINDLSGGIIIDDFDNDGFLDVVASAWDLRGQLRIFKNNGDGTFTQRTSEAGLVGITGGLNLQQTDYNNDGFIDIFVPRGAWLGRSGHFPNSLLRNNGDGTFTDVTEEAGLMSFRPVQACEWFDFDGDGWLDLFLGNESQSPNEREWCELFRNNHDGTFTECAKESGIAVAAFIKGVTAADYDNDGRPDLYLSCRTCPNLLFHNDGPAGDPANPKKWKFTQTTKAAGVELPIESFATWFFDYDNDGFQDLFCAGYVLPNGVSDIAADYLGLPGKAGLPKLYHNNGNGTFSDVTKEAHLNRVCHTMGCNFGDLDNDGWLDFYCGTGDPDFATIIPNRMMRNAGGKLFQDVTAGTGTGHLQKGHGVSFADIDNDGDQDIYIVLGGVLSGDNAKNALFLNPGSTNAWLNLRLVGVRANRPAIGARLNLTVKTPHGPRNIFRTVTHGASFGANPLRQEIGLGDATEVVSVEIRWPGSDTRQTIRDLKINHAYEIREGAEAATAREFKKAPLLPAASK